eukprot:1710673-Rhodomonas_salina.1
MILVFVILQLRAQVSLPPPSLPPTILPPLPSPLPSIFSLLPFIPTLLSPSRLNLFSPSVGTTVYVDAAPGSDGHAAISSVNDGNAGNECGVCVGAGLTERGSDRIGWRHGARARRDGPLPFLLPCCSELATRE